MTIQARYSGVCTVCGSRIPAGASVEWDRSTRAIRHADAADCHAPAPTPVASLHLQPIADFLAAARDRGLKFPKLRVLAPDNATELRLSITSSGAAPGSVSVKRHGEWIGTVRPTGDVRGPLADDLTLQAHLLRVAVNPVEAAKAYAALMSRCCFCGLQLTDMGSVECGYGPVCAEHWGLPHTALGTLILEPVVDLRATTAVV
jgi:hypothetical protein